MLEASLKEMRKAYLRNSRASGALQGSHNEIKSMLAFYSAECGLKAVVMADGGHKTSSLVAEKFKHNIRALVIEAKMGAAEISGRGAKSNLPPSIKRATSGAEISFSELHTAMRYGIEIDASGSAQSSQYLSGVIAALKKRLGF